jgi:outer membrane protein assembly factor BamB
MARLILRYPNNLIKEVDFEQSRYRIGSATDNDLVLDGEEVAPHQAEIEIRDGAYTLTDRSEDNSTTVNGKTFETISITYGDRIAFGPINGLFYPPQKRRSMGERGKMLVYMIAGGGALVVIIAVILVLINRQISSSVLQSRGGAAIEEIETQPGPREEFPVSEGFEDTPEDVGPRGGTGDMRADGRGGGGFAPRLFGGGKVALPEPAAEQIETRTAVAVPRGLRRLFFRKIPIVVTGSESLPIEIGPGEFEPEDSLEEFESLQTLEPVTEDLGDAETFLEDFELEGFDEEPADTGFLSGLLSPFRRMFGGLFGEVELPDIEELVDFGEAIEEAEEATAVTETSETVLSAGPMEGPGRTASAPSRSFAEIPVYTDEELKQIRTGTPPTIPSLSSTATIQCEAIWSFLGPPEEEAHLVRSGMIGRINEDRYWDVVFGTSTNEIVAVDGQLGTELFRQDLEKPFFEPIVHDFNGDGDEDILVVYEHGEIAAYAYNDQNPGALEPIWRYMGNVRITGLPVLLDIDADRNHDLVFATLEMDIIAVSGTTGFELWRFFDAETEILHSPVGLPVNNDRVMDVVFSTRKGFLYAIDGSNGWGLWKRALPGRLTGPPVVADLSGDGHGDIVTLTRDGSLTAFSRDGKQLSTWDLEGSFSVSPSIGDINGDRVNEIVLVDNGGVLRVIEGATRREIWTAPSPEGPLTGRIVLADLDEDRAMEIVLPSLSGALLVLDGSSGETLAVYNTGGRIWATPIVYDLNRDRIKEIVVGTEAGELFAIRVMGSTRGVLSLRRSGWKSVHHDVRNSGHASSQFLLFPWM